MNLYKENKMSISGKVCILIQAGEGDTQEVFVGKSREDLIDSIHIFYEEEIKSDTCVDDVEFHESCDKSLCEMLTKHEDWESGRYILENIEPQWEQWTLVIVSLRNKGIE